MGVQLGLAQNFFQQNKSFQSTQHAETTGIQKFEAYDVDHDALKAYLSQAEMEFKSDKGLVLDIPVPKYGTMAFHMFESPCMMEGISARYQQIKSYKGYAIENPSIICRMDFGTQGMHGSIITREGSVYIDPTENSNKGNYVVYFTKDQLVSKNPVSACGMDPQDADVFDQLPSEVELEASTRSGAEIPLRVYRLAIATTGEFGETIGMTVENTLSVLNTSVNRLNMIFENELAIRLVLVDDNDQLFNFDRDEDDFFDGRNSGARETNPGPGLLAENPIFINNKIGFGNYDIGHIYTRGCYSVGGVASLGSLCGGVNNRARGVTCFFGTNIENITVRTVAHEIGHQMAAQHSFNHCDMMNESLGTGYEPGSGITIMSYAGACDNINGNGLFNNLANTNFDVFHVGSIEQMYSFTREGNGTGCGVIQESGNHEPDITLNYENGFTIPISTPFELTGEAEDMDGDTMSFTWEQHNAGPLVTVLGEPWGNAPTFRNYYPDTEKTRHFPILSNTLNNSSDKREVLPTYSRDLNFYFVARDNSYRGGTTVWEEVAFYASDQAGPFQVLTQQDNNTYEVGERVLVQWDVANTDQAPINTKYVDIELSTDGGFNLDHVLLENTLNDGEEYVYIPEAVTSTGRIKIKAVDNIYYDYNNINFTVNEAPQPGYYFNVENTAYTVCAPTLFTIPMEGVSYGGYDEQIEYSVLGLPGDISYSFSDNNISSTAATMLELDLSEVLLNDNLVITVQGVSATNDTIMRDVELEIISVDYSEIANVFPLDGSSDNAVTPFFKWVGSSNADSYTIEVSTSAKFDTDDTRIISNIEADSVSFTEILEKNTIYYWRVLGENRCGTAESGDIYAFSTLSESCNSYAATDLPINITQSGMPTIESKLFITDQGQASDVNVSVSGSHTFISQLRGYLVSPSGKEARMFGNNCFNLSNFNCSFDDESAFEISCPLTGGLTFKPQQELAAFKGEEIEGEWTFRIEDTDGGDGGKFESFSLNICSSASLENPYILNNQTLTIEDGARRNIGESLLRALHPNVESGDLFFTVIRTPAVGSLLLNNIEVREGDQFTQADIDANRLDYRHSGENISEDSFLFTVVDNKGGWIPTTAFNIEVSSFTSTEEPVDVEDVFAVYPNPTDGNLVLRAKDFADSYSVQIMDTQGRLIYNGTRSGSISQVDITGFNAGIYILKIENEDVRQIVKLIRR